MDWSHALTSNPPVGAKVLMARATMADLLKRPLPGIAESSGHIRANSIELLGGRGGGEQGEEEGISQGAASVVLAET